MGHGRHSIYTFAPAEITTVPQVYGFQGGSPQNSTTANNFSPQNGFAVVKRLTQTGPDTWLRTTFNPEPTQPNPTQNQTQTFVFLQTKIIVSHQRRRNDEIPVSLGIHHHLAACCREHNFEAGRVERNEGWFAVTVQQNGRLGTLP